MKAKNNFFLFVFLLALVGLIISALTVYEHVLLQLGQQIGLELQSGLCVTKGAFNCKKVIGSNWSYFLGVPLGFYGIAFYAVIMLLSVTALEERFISNRLANSVLLFFSSGAALISLFLFYVSSVEIGALCALCLSTYVVNGVLFLAAAFIDRSESFGARWSRGAQAVTRLPLSMFGTQRIDESFTSAVARFWVVVSFFVALSMWFLPDYLGNQFVVPKAQEQQFSQKEEKALEDWKLVSQQQIALNLEGGADVDFAVGDKNAPITVVEFSDYQCPACRATYAFLAEIWREYKGKFLLVHRDYPLDKACNHNIDRSFHDGACMAAELARCAGEQGKFKEAEDLLFHVPALEHVKDLAETRRELLNAASVLGVDRPALEACMSSGRHLPKIQRDVSDGDHLGLEGTPTYWINGKKLNVVTPRTMRAVFDHILQGK